MIPTEDGLYAEYLQHRIALLPVVGISGGECRDRTYDQLIKRRTWRSLLISVKTSS